MSWTHIGWRYICSLCQNNILNEHNIFIPCQFPTNSKADSWGPSRELRRASPMKFPPNRDATSTSITSSWATQICDVTIKSRWNHKDNVRAELFVKVLIILSKWKLLKNDGNDPIWHYWNKSPLLLMSEVDKRGLFLPNQPAPECRQQNWQWGCGHEFQLDLLKKGKEPRKWPGL